MAKEHDPSYRRKANKIPKIDKLDQSMSRILHVINEREQIRKNFRTLLEEDYIKRKKEELAEKVAKQPKPLPEITHEMLRAKYHELRKGIDNVKYLEKICKCVLMQGIRTNSIRPEIKGQIREFKS